jgi:hypothetical protein
VINSDYARNYQLIDMESTLRIGFLPGITVLAQGKEIHPRNMIPPGITSSWKLIQTDKIKQCEKTSKR